MEECEIAGSGCVFAVEEGECTEMNEDECEVMNGRVFSDEISGEPLDTEGVMAARAEEMTGADSFAPDPITVKVKVQDEDDPFSKKTEKFEIPSSFLESLQNSFKGL